MKGLIADDISFSYGRRPILSELRFDELPRGQITALIGPNASGKSTLFKVIAGLLKPSMGAVSIGPLDLSTLTQRARLKHICFMPQFFSANAALTVFDVVMMAHKHLQGWRVNGGDMQAVASALHTAGIGHLAEAYVGELSGGQSQMVSIAQALIRKAEVYLFDEPTSALDLHHQLSVLTRIRGEIVKRNAIGVIALHDLNLAARFADHLLLLGDGKILAEGPPSSVLGREAISEVYGVDIELSTGPRQELLVHAY